MSCIHNSSVDSHTLRNSAAAAAVLAVADIHIHSFAVVLAAEDIHNHNHIHKPTAVAAAVAVVLAEHTSVSPSHSTAQNFGKGSHSRLDSGHASLYWCNLDLEGLRRKLGRSPWF